MWYQARVQQEELRDLDSVPTLNVFCLSALAREITNLVARRRVDGKETLSSQVALTLSQSAHSKCSISPGLFTYWFKKTLTDFSFIVYFIIIIFLFILERFRQLSI